LRTVSRKRCKKRIGRPPLPDDELVSKIKAVIAELATYGYRRVHAVLKRPRARSGMTRRRRRRATTFPSAATARSSGRSGCRTGSTPAGLPVVDGGKMVGIVTKFDFLRAFVFTTSQMMPRYDGLMKRPVQQIMTECVSSIEPTTPLPRVLELMVSLKARSFPVVDAKGEVVGMISREDVRQALGEATQNAD
jgi:CBS domain-containing protein